MNAARHLADLAADLTSRKASGERTLKVWGHRRGLSLPEVRRLAAQLVAQGLLVEGEGAGGRVWRPVERTGRDLPPLEIETGEPSPTPPPASVERAAEAPSFEVEKEEAPVAGVVEEPAFAEGKAPAEPEAPPVAGAEEELFLVTRRPDAPPVPSPRSLFAGLAPEARRNVADVLQELANHLRQEPTPSGKIGRGPDNLSSNARAVLAILPRGGEPSITRKEIKARSGLDNTNSVSTALRTLERLTLATSPSWGLWRAV